MSSFKRLRIFFISLSIIATVSFAVFSAFIVHSLVNLSSVKALERYTPPMPTKVLDVKGRFIAELFAEKRELIPFNELPPNLIHAVIATEDERFFSNLGFNPWRMFQALLVNLFTRDTTQGGSAITVQLSRLLFLNQEKTIARKIKELWYTIQIEKQYSKEEILLFYFNQIPYGHGCYGVEAAAKFFFNKKAKDLDLAECAMLAGIPNSPYNYSPIRFPSKAMKRQTLVLTRMVNENYILEDEAVLAYRNFWKKFNSETRSRQTTANEIGKNNAPYFIEYIRERLEKMYGKNELYKGGFSVYTTLDLDLQIAAERYMTEVIETQNKIYKDSMQYIMRSIRSLSEEQLQMWSDLFDIPYDVPVSTTKFRRLIENTLYSLSLEQLKTVAFLLGQDHVVDNLSSVTMLNEADNHESIEGALISIDPATGYIVAMVGGSGFGYRNQFNHVFQAKRQIGSLMKPFVYAAAIEKKVITGATILEDAPTVFGNVEEGNYYVPVNYGGKYEGNVLAREALKSSINVCAVKVLDMVGINNVRDFAGKIFRVTTDSESLEKFPQDLTMSLGTGIFTPFNVAVAFSLFANEGKEVVPLSIRFVTDSTGQVVTNIEKQYMAVRKQVIDPATAFIMTRIMNGVFQPGGTAFKPDLLEGFSHVGTSYGKTGTTSNWADAWFVGFNKYLCTVVWFGFDSNKSLGLGRVGGALASPVWIKFNKTALQSKKVIDFSVPNNVTMKEVCKESGLLRTPSCSKHYTEYFIMGTEPNSFCDHHEKKYQDKIDFINRVYQAEKSSGVSAILKFSSKNKKMKVETNEVIDAETNSTLP